MDRDLEMTGHISFTKEEGGFTSPAAAVALLVVCALVFICARGIAIGSRSGQIQYVADAGALAADNVVAEFVTVGQAVDATLLSLSLLALTVYGVSAVAAFIPGGQGAAVEIANVGSKIFQARDKIADAASRGLDAAQKVIPALCAIRGSEIVKANADASGIGYAGIAITSPISGIDISLSDDRAAEEAAREIESKEDDIQKESLRQQEAQKREDDAKRRAWEADCGKAGMNMQERAGKLSSISPARNPRYSSPDNWSFSVPLNRAQAYYAARYRAEPGASAHGSPEDIAESVARKRFYAYAQSEVSRGYIEKTELGGEIPHLVELARNTNGIRQTSLYTDASYPVSENGGACYIHAYYGCPTYESGSDAGCAAVCEVDSGSVLVCPDCQFSPKTLGRVPSASTSISNGFEYYYLRVVEASRDYAQAVQDSEASKRALAEARSSIGKLLSQAVESLSNKRYDPQPPGRYGCVCVVLAPSAKLGNSPFLKDDASIPARIAISGAALAPDPASDEGNVISGIAQGLIPQDNLGSGVAKTIFGAWGTMLDVYSKGIGGIKAGFKKVLGTIPLVGTTISDQAVSTFETALNTAGLQPADLKTYKPVLVNTSYILDRDAGKAATVISRMKQAGAMYGAISVGDVDALVEDIKSLPEISSMLDEHGLEIASVSLSDLGLGPGERKIYFPVPKNIYARLEEARSALESFAN